MKILKLVKIDDHYQNIYDNCGKLDYYNINVENLNKFFLLKESYLVNLGKPHGVCYQPFKDVGFLPSIKCFKYYTVLDFIKETDY